MPFCWMKFCSGCFRQVFVIWGMGGGGAKEVVAGCIRQVVVLCSNNCMGIGLRRRLRLVVILQRWS